MKLETFFEKFDQFADAPDAVAKMRELVLDLAVQGKVADQDPNDEPAAELLNRLIQFKLDNPLTGRSGRSKEGPVEVEASSDDLPRNWVNTTIGEVLYVIRGASPRPKGDPQYFSEARTPYHWVKISDIRKHGQSGLLMDTDEFLTEAGMRKSVLLPKGTLVLTNSATIGVPIVLGIEGCCIHDGYLAFPNFPHELLSQKFLLYLFHTLKKHAERNARGLAQLNLNTDLVRSFPFGLPPLAEQTRIVAKVNELMALCDRLEAQQQERETRHASLARASLARFADAPTPANLPFLFHPSYAIPPADLRKSILTLAGQGKLVPPDPNDEPADDLLEAIQKEKLSLVKRGLLKRADPIDRESNHALPAGWSLVTLAAMCVAVTDGDHLPPPKAETGIPFLVIGNVRWGGIDFESCRFVEEDYFNKLDWIRKPVPGDVLYTLVGSFGIPVLVGNVRPFCVQRHIGILRPSKHIDHHYLGYALASGSVLQQVTAIATGIAQKTVPLTGLRKVKIPLPPLAEQRRIVAKVEQLMALVDALETQLAASRATAANLLSALVAELTRTGTR